MKILVASPIDTDALEALRSRHDVCAPRAPGAPFEHLLADREVLVFRSGVALGEERLAAAPRLRALIRAGSGVDNVDLEAVRRRGIRLIVLSGPGSIAVAELTLGLMLALSRHLVRAHSELCEGRWTKEHLLGHQLAGRTLGVVGVGTIGRQVALRGAAFGMRVIGCVEHPSVERAAALALLGMSLVSFEETISTADVVSVHVPLKGSTRHLIDARALRRMKRGALLINLARGGVVNERALAIELARPLRLGGAALDVHEAGEGNGRPALAGLPNVLLTPHIGAMTLESQRALGREIVDVIDSLDRPAGELELADAQSPRPTWPSRTDKGATP